MNRSTALALLLAPLGCLAADDPEPASPADPQIRRCASAHPTPDVDAVLADSAPALAAGHERFGALLAVSQPIDLDFDPAHPARVADSKQRFKRYLQALAKHTAATYRAYDAGHSSAGCAAAEVALDWVAYQLETMPIPALGDGEYLADMEAAYCDALADQGRFFRARRCSRAP